MRVYEGIIGWLQEREPWSTILTLCLFAVIPHFLAPAYGAGHWKTAAGLAFALLVLAILQVGLLSLRNKLGQYLPERVKAISAILEGTAQTVKNIVGTDKHLRVCVMLPSPDGKNRKVTYRYGFDKNDTDRDLELATEAGNTGVVWGRREPHYTDMQKAAEMVAKPDPGAPDYRLTPAQQKLVRPTLKSMLSVPIFDPDSSEGPLLGTLSFDSDNTLNEMRFTEKNICEIAQQFARILSLVLKR